MHSRRLLLLLLFLVVLAAVTKITESLSDRPISPSITTNPNPIAESEERSEATATMASISPEDASLIDDPLPEMPLLPITSKATVRACGAMNISSKDVFVCSYPKSGTTWTQNIVVRLLWESAGDVGDSSLPLPEDWHLSQSAPFYEVDQYWRPKQRKKESNAKDRHGDETEPPMERIPAQTPIISCRHAIDDSNRDGEFRVFNTHLLPHQLPERARCVYVVRDPLDVMVSFYHHLSNQAVEDGGYTGSFEEFFEGFLDGTIVYGKWQDHVEAWLGRGKGSDNDTKFLVLHYEDMKQDLARETKRLARFLFDDNNEMSTDRYLENIVSRVVPHCTFEAMKRERKRYTPLTVSWKIDPQTGMPYDDFVRKGTVGDGRKFLLEATKTTSPISAFTSRDRWIDTEARIARARWKKAGVKKDIIDRYLQQENQNL